MYCLDMGFMFMHGNELLLYALETTHGFYNLLIQVRKICEFFVLVNRIVLNATNMLTCIKLL